MPGISALKSHPMRAAILLVGTIAIVVVVVAVAFFQETAPRPYVSGPGDIAIQGFDTVAYFVDNRAVKGSGAFTHPWREATWQFVSAENRDLFATEPDRYAPQFGGFCSLGVGMDMFVHADPESWTIVDGKLYMQYNSDARDKWRADIESNLAKAEEVWSERSRKF